LGALLFYLIYVCFTLYYLLLLIVYGHPDFGPIISGYIGFIFLEAAYISVGVLISSTTKNQIVSGIATLLVLLFFWIVGWISNYFNNLTVKNVLSYLSFLNHFQDFSKGIIDTRHIIFYITVIWFNLFLTVRLIENRKTIN